MASCGSRPRQELFADRREIIYMLRVGLHKIVFTVRAHQLKNASSIANKFNFRVQGSIVAMLLMSALLLGRLFYLQIVNTDYYQVRAENNRINATPIPPNRGLILDSKGHVLAKNYASYVLELMQRDGDDPYKIINRLSDLIAISPQDSERFAKALKC